MAYRSINYFFYVHDHSTEEIMELINHSRDTYDELPQELQEVARTVMVLPGPNITFFAV